jgi:SH3 domain protein
MYRPFVYLFSLFAQTRSITRPRMTVFFPFVFLFPLFAAPTEVLAENPQYRYVADEFRITMRRGPAASFKVVRMLKTGMKLTLLEKGDLGWDRVRAKNGAEGWVLRRFVQKEAPAKIQVVEIKTALEKMQKERDSLKDQLQVVNQGLTGYEGMEQELKKKYQDTEAELQQLKEVSGQSMLLNEQNLELLKRAEEAEEQLAQVSLENENLVKRSDTNFFLAGAAVLVLGVIIGAILFRRRRTSYDSL